MLIKNVQIFKISIRDRRVYYRHLLTHCLQHDDWIICVHESNFPLQRVEFD